ncbi:hypothetical protein D3C72_2113380 [compost metagenome]
MAVCRASTLPFCVTPERDTTCDTLPSVESACTTALLPAKGPLMIVAPRFMGVALPEIVGVLTELNETSGLPLEL